MSEFTFQWCEPNSFSLGISRNVSYNELSGEEGVVIVLGFLFFELIFEINE